MNFFLLSIQVHWCKVIFADDPDLNPSNVLIDLYTDTLRSLEPSLQFCFEAEIKKVSFIELLIQFNQGTHRFVESIRQLLELQSKLYNLLIQSSTSNCDYLSITHHFSKF